MKKPNSTCGIHKSIIIPTSLSDIDAGLKHDISIIIH